MLEKQEIVLTRKAKIIIERQKENLQKIKVTNQRRSLEENQEIRRPRNSKSQKRKREENQEKWKISPGKERRGEENQGKIQNHIQRKKAEKTKPLDPRLA